MFIAVLAEKEPSGRALCSNKSCVLQQFGDSFTPFSRFVSINDCFVPCCKNLTSEELTGARRSILKGFCFESSSRISAGSSESLLDRILGFLEINSLQMNNL